MWQRCEWCGKIYPRGDEHFDHCSEREKWESLNRAVAEFGQALEERITQALSNDLWNTSVP